MEAISNMPAIFSAENFQGCACWLPILLISKETTSQHRIFKYSFTENLYQGPFLVSHLLGLGQSRQVIFQNCWVGKNAVADFLIDLPGIENAMQ
jgi:hypothetical protein